MPSSPVTILYDSITLPALQEAEPAMYIRFSIKNTRSEEKV
jgi:hypothetical protein